MHSGLLTAEVRERRERTDRRADVREERERGKGGIAYPNERSLSNILKEDTKQESWTQPEE
jgi:hypothetical protein